MLNRNRARKGGKLKVNSYLCVNLIKRTLLQCRNFGIIPKNDWKMTNWERSWNQVLSWNNASRLGWKNSMWECKRMTHVGQALPLLQAWTKTHGVNSKAKENGSLTSFSGKSESKGPVLNLNFKKVIFCVFNSLMETLVCVDTNTSCANFTIKIKNLFLFFS